ncbi:FAD-dependent thymidylate synthase [Nanoarchaeota archaeon]
MARINNPEADAILDKEFPVLDRGFVRLVDYLGGDARIVQAARVSYGPGTKTIRENKGLINYLLKHQHTSPFEQVVMTFHLKMPIFVARQWVRHRTARMNEISGRYSVMPEEMYVPEPEDVNIQSTDNRQGRGEAVSLEDAELIRTQIQQAGEAARETYDNLIEKGVSRELARTVLPLAQYTEFYWQMDLHNLFHFLKLRSTPHAQKEIRDYAVVMGRIVEKVAPLAYDAFENHVLLAEKFSRDEMALIVQAINSEQPESIVNGSELSKSRKSELLAKLGL